MAEFAYPVNESQYLFGLGLWAWMVAFLLMSGANAAEGAPALRDGGQPDYRRKRDVLAPILIGTQRHSATIREDVEPAERSLKVEMEASGRPGRAADPSQSAPSSEPTASAAHTTQSAPVNNATVAAAQTVTPPVDKEAAEKTKTVLAPPPDIEAPNPASDSAAPPSSPAPLPEQEPPAPPVRRETASPFRFSYGTQILAYGAYNAVRSNSPFNPQNLLAALPYEDSHLAVRPNLSLDFSIFSFSAKPRLDLDHPFSGSSHTLAVYMQEWGVRLRPTHTLTLSYAREVLMWGPSMSVPASNPFFSDNGRNTPLLEIGARGFARLIWQPNARFAATYIANTSLGRGTDLMPFRKTGALKLDYIGSSLLVSAIYANSISQPFGPQEFIGGYIQKTIGQAVRIYAEGSAEQGNPNLYPVSALNGLGWQLTQAELNGPLRVRTIVGGLAYTDSSGGTWNGEYVYNPFGYTSMFAASFYNLAGSASSSFLQGGQLAPLAAAELAAASSPANGALLRRNYAFAQYQRNGLPGRIDLVLRYTLSADDRSGQAVAFVTWNSNNHLQLFALVAGMNGSLDTEFARYLRFQTQLGLRVFLH